MRARSKPMLLTCLLAAASPSTLAAEDPLLAAAEASLEIRFVGLTAPDGAVLLSLFDSETAHDQGGEPVRTASIKVEGEAVVARISGLVAGDYAVRAFHDINEDGALDTNPFGLPIEPFAFSNDAIPMGGPALWQATRFVIGPGQNSITITFR